MIEIRAEKVFPVFHNKEPVRFERLEVEVKSQSIEAALRDYGKLAETLNLPQKVVETSGKD